MRKILLGIIGLAMFAMPVSAQTAEEIVAKYIKTIGGVEKIEAIKTLRRTGKYTGGGGFEAVVIQENKRPQMARQEFSMQGMTGVNAYDGKTGWKIEPWQGKKDAEPLGEVVEYSCRRDGRVGATVADENVGHRSNPILPRRRSCARQRAAPKTSRRR